MLPLIAHVLGSSAARPYVDRGTSSLYVQAGGNRILIDCGEGTQVEIDRQGLSAQKLDVVCITHMHGDHVYGLPGLLGSLALGQRSKPLTLIGPPPLASYLEQTFKYSEAHLTFPLTFIVTRYDQPTRDVLVLKDLCIHTVPLKHRIPTAGFVIEQRGKGLPLKEGIIDEYRIPYPKIEAIKNGEDFLNKKGVKIANSLLTNRAAPPTPLAYFTDTAPLESYPAGWTSPAVLFHDATFAGEDHPLAEKTGHSTVLDAAAFAKTCEAGELILMHISERYKDRELLLKEAQSAFAKTSLA